MPTESYDRVSGSTLDGTPEDVVFIGRTGTPQKVELSHERYRELIQAGRDAEKVPDLQEKVSNLGRILEEKEERLAELEDRPLVPDGYLKRVLAKVHGPRAASYGHPRDNLGCTAALWTTYLRRRCQANGGALPALGVEDVAVLNVLQKVSRLAQTPDHEDSWEDVAGYVETVFMARNPEG